MVKIRRQAFHLDLPCEQLGHLLAASLMLLAESWIRNSVLRTQTHCPFRVSVSQTVALPATPQCQRLDYLSVREKFNLSGVFREKVIKQPVKSPLRTAISQIRVLVGVSSAMHQIQLLANEPEKAAGKNPSTRILTIHADVRNDIPGVQF